MVGWLLEFNSDKTRRHESCFPSLKNIPVLHAQCLFVLFFNKKVKDQPKISDLQPEILRHSFIVLQIRSNILVCHPGIQELNILNLNFPPHHLSMDTHQSEQLLIPCRLLESILHPVTIF